MLFRSGIALSSPVTRGRPDIPDQRYLTDPREPRLQPTYVRRPSIVLRNDLDECEITPPAGAVAFYNDLRAAGVDATSAAATGGFKVTAGASAADLDPCQSLGFHSFMGIESLAVGQITGWLDNRLAMHGVNGHPRATFASRVTQPGASLQLNLETITTDPDGDAMTYILPYAETSLGGSVSLSAAVVTYTPPAGVSSGIDRFVYAATDAHGAVGAAVVSIEIRR